MSSRSASENKKVRYAVVGLGHISQIAMLPAFEHAQENSELVAFVSSDDEKIDELKKKYNVKHAYSYEQFEELLKSGLIDAVYVATPNSEHREFVVKAANAGIHVLCEKPLAATDFDASAMQDAAESANIKMMTAYRLHFDEANMKVVEIANSGKLGELKYFTSQFSMQVKPNNIRTKKDLGGGPLTDLGVYCINASRYIFRAEPVEVTAFATKSKDERFEEIPETVGVLMRFSDGQISNFVCSFGALDVSRYELVGTEGILVADPAYDYSEGNKFTVKIGEKTETFEFPKRDQFASQLIHFSKCILEDKEPIPSGIEGLADVTIIAAINESIKTGTAVTLDKVEPNQRPSIADVQKHPPVKKPELVKVDGPHY